MSKIAEKIADSLCHREVIEECDREIYKYGYEVLLENIGKTLFLLVAGGILRQFTVTLIFIIAFTTLRSCCGGYHASESWKCDLLTIFLWGMVVAGTSLLESILVRGQTFMILIAVMSQLVIYQYAPVEHKDKRLTKEKQERNRRCALGLGLIYGILILLLTFTLTRFGAALALSVLEVVILMIIPNEGRTCGEETDGF